MIDGGNDETLLKGPLPDLGDMSLIITENHFHESTKTIGQRMNNHSQIIVRQRQLLDVRNASDSVRLKLPIANRPGHLQNAQYTAIPTVLSFC